MAERKRRKGLTLEQQLGLTRYHLLPAWLSRQEATLVVEKMRQWNMDSVEEALRACIAQGLIKAGDGPQD